ncbi:SnoaL-like domain-containing protein [Dokdonella soli]|uniref:SnoaL-like domain-containing protein n=1 Tax=Dokdonella soli TaxID=529810 RepID=A0ABN1IDJ9_9GAMM
MNTEQIAQRLVTLCREGKFEQAHDELYADNAVSIEPDGLPPGALGSVQGLAAIRDKGRQFQERTEAVHSMAVSEPLISGNWFCVTMTMDITMKQYGRMTMGEICVYHVHEGRIDREQFFYDVG